MDGELEKQLHDHDLRLTRVEAELQGVHKEIREQRKDIRLNAEIARGVQAGVMALTSKVSELSGSHKLLLWGLGLFCSFLAGLEVWTVFR